MASGVVAVVTVVTAAVDTAVVVVAACCLQLLPAAATVAAAAGSGFCLFALFLSVLKKFSSRGSHHLDPEFFANGFFHFEGCSA